MTKKAHNHKTTEGAGAGEPEETPEGANTDPTGADPVAELQRQLDEKHAAYVRALADFQNFQRRASENELRARDHGVTSIARAIVPVLEHLDVALGHDLYALDAKKLAEAVVSFRSEMLKALAKSGIERVEPAIGDEFDPKLHEAVMQQASDQAKPGHVAMCLQAGYRFGEMPLRSAKVAVVPSAD